MATMTYSDILDIAVTTYENQPKLRFQQIAQKIQDYEILPRVFKRAQSISGESITKQLMVKHGDNARHVGLFNTDVTAVQDVMKKINTPFRHAITSYGFDRREISANQAGPWQIVDLMKVRRADAMLAQAQLFEEAAFKSPPSDADELQPHGIPYWITFDSVSPTEGFTGDTPTGHSLVGGLSHPNWLNYVGPYSSVSKDDLLTVQRKAFLLISWKSPVTVRDFRRGLGQRHRYYVDSATRLSLETLGEKQNENLGRDLASMDGQIVFRGIPYVWVPVMDTLFGDGRIYMVDWDYIVLYFMKGRALLESKPQQSAKSHNVIETFIDTTYNYQAFDRRRLAVLPKV